jgi:hypothetical protein
LGVTAVTSQWIYRDQSGSAKRIGLGRFIPTQPVYGTGPAAWQMLAGDMQNDPNATSQEPVLVRHNAVSWIQQSLSQGHTLGRALALASQLAWAGAIEEHPRATTGAFAKPVRA